MYTPAGCETRIVSGWILPGCGPLVQGLEDFCSSLRLARRTDPALSHTGIVRRKEGTCSAGFHDATSGGSASSAASKHGGHDDGGIVGNAGPGGSGSGSGSGKIYR